jgi:hypothetical protein
MTMKPKALGNGRAVALGGTMGPIKSFNQGAPKPGVSAWEGKHKAGGKMTFKAKKGGA